MWHALDELEDDINSHKSVLSDILTAVRTGVKPCFTDNDANYYMVNFNVPSAGRYHLSNETCGKYNDLLENLYKWYCDTSIFTGFGSSCITKYLQDGMRFPNWLIISHPPQKWKRRF